MSKAAPLTIRTTPGILAGIQAERYHADDLLPDRPTLSASVAHLICSRSPRHAWAVHPRLNPNMKRDEKAHYDLGTACHAALLEGLDIVTPVDAPDWKTKAAREERDLIRSQGRIPLLADTFEELQRMIAAIHAQLAEHHAEPPLFRDGAAEQTLVWEEPGGVVCRSRLDWLRDDHTAVDDLKSSSRSASPAAYARRLFEVGGDIQCAMYRRGVEKLTGTRPEFRLCVVETKPPYALSVISLAPSALELGERKLEYAIGKWRECLLADSWPGYPQRVAYAEAPSWEEVRWIDKEFEEEEEEEAA